MEAPYVPDFPAWVNADRETERIFREAEQGICLYRLQCAAITNGCTSALVFEGEPSIALDHLDPLVWSDRRAARLLALNGWHVDHGRWICGAHPATVPSSQPIEIRRRPPEEVRERLLSSSLPPDLASALADEMAPEGQ